MLRSVVLWVAVVLAVAVAGIGVWAMFAAPGEVPTSSGSGSAAERFPTSDVPGIASDVVGTDGEVDAAPVRRDAVVEEEAQPFHTVRLLVLDKATGEPLPGTEVSYFENFSRTTLTPEERQEYESLLSDEEQLTARYGSSVIADAHGVAYLRARVHVRVTGRLGGLYGETRIRRGSFNPFEDEYRLELERDSNLEVRILDGAGIPAPGVRVGLHPVWEEGRAPARSPRPRPLGVSGPSGDLTVAHLQGHIRGWNAEEPFPVKYLLRASIPGWRAGGVALDPENPPDGPVVLQLPPTGRVVVHAVDGSGGAVPPEIVGTASLSLVPEEPARDANGNLTARSWPAVRSGTNTPVFDRVVAGRQYAVRVGIGGVTAEEVFPGPTVHGQVVDVTVAAGQRIFYVTGRVLGEDRTPLGNTPVRLRYAVNGSTRRARTATTREDGTLAASLRVEEEIEQPELTMFAVEDRPPGGSANPAPAMFAMTGSRPLVPGGNDLGELILASAPVVVAGRFTIEGEVPDEKVANVIVERMEIDGGVEYGWRRADFTLRYPEVDRFDVRGIAPAGRYRLRVDSRSVRPVEPIEFSPGTDDLLIDLHSGGSAVASVLVDEFPHVTELWMELFPTDGQPAARQFAYADRLFARQLTDRSFGRITWEERGLYEFEWTGLWPGGYRLEVRTRGTRTPVVVIPDVGIEGGETTEDPRLQEIDLRGRFRKLEVRVVDAIESAAVDDGFVVVDEPDPDGDLQGFLLHDGVASIVTGEPTVDLLVAAEGHVPREVRGVSSDVTVTLERPPVVSLRVAGGAPELPPGHTLWTTLAIRGNDADRRRLMTEGGNGPLQSMLERIPEPEDLDSGAAEVVATRGAGVYEVVVWVRNDEAGTSTAVKEISPAEVSVRSGAGSQVYEIRIPEQELVRALERVRKR